MTEAIYPFFRILLVDDEPTWLDSLALSLERLAGITNVTQCQDSREVQEILDREPIGLVLLDLTMPHQSGKDILHLVAEHYPEVVVIVLTGMNQIETAVDCMRQGAYDYYVKTEGEERIVTSVLNTVRMIEMRHENYSITQRLLNDALEHPEAFSEIQSGHKTMRSVFRYVESVAISGQPILITGESGVGKELIAKAVHALSERSGPMVRVNVSGLDDNMFADTLFGHVKGAFSGAALARNGLIEEASQGTLFLDEMGDLSISSQLKLLRVLNDGEYYPLGSDRPKRSRARVIAATNQDLQAKIRDGSFRKDLYYRLKTHQVQLPPLRERKDDLPALVDHFLQQAARELQKKAPKVPKELLTLLQTYSFPGNIRELKAMVFDAVTRNRTPTLALSTFVEAMGGASSGSHEDRNAPSLFSELETLPRPDEVVQELIDEALRRTGGNQSMAARLLGVSQPALNRRIRRAQVALPED